MGLRWRSCVKCQINNLNGDSYTGNRSTGSLILVEEATNNTVAAGMII
jgi:sulfate adenylyltransferase subunit 1 (EFTu-like GTPase family)